MQLQLRGRKTTYHAGYRANASGDNIGIGLWTNNHTLDNLKDLVYLTCVLMMMAINSSSMSERLKDRAFGLPWKLKTVVF